MNSVKNNVKDDKAEKMANLSSPINNVNGDTTVKKANIFRAINSERIKFFSLRSNIVLMIIVLLAVLGITLISVLLYSTLIVDELAKGMSVAKAQEMFWQIVNSSEQIVFILLTVLAIINVTSEFSNETVLSSVSVIQRRGIFYNAKILFFGILGFITSFIVINISFFQAYVLVSNMIRSKATMAEFYTNGFVTSILGRSLTLTLMIVIVISLAFIMKNQIGTVMTHMIVNYIASPVLLSLFGHYKVKAFALFIQSLPYNALTNVTTNGGANSDMAFKFDISIPLAYLTLIGWAVIIYILALIFFKKRDL